MRVISSRGFSWFPTFGPALCCQHFLCFILRNRSIQMTVVHVSKACGSSCLTHVINGKIEVEAIYNFQRFLVEEFFLPVIKPPGTYFNDKLLPSCRSSKLSSSFPATSVLLCAPLDQNRPDRNSKSAWRQSNLIFLRQTLHWKLRRAATFLIK